MNRLSELKEKRKLDNKGFSLVELIIVIAIMAVLIGVLAPQYLKYVEKSRTATDQDNVTAIISAIQVYGADPDSTKSLASGDKITLTGAKGGGTPGSAITTDTNGALADALTQAGLTLPTKGLTNKQTYSNVVIEVTIDTTTGLITVAPTWNS